MEPNLENKKKNKKMIKNKKTLAKKRKEKLNKSGWTS